MQYGLVSRRAMQRACVACYAIAVGLGLVMVAARGTALLWIGAVGIFLSLQYTGAPLRLVYRGLGEPVTALGFGPVMTIGAYYVCAQQWSWSAVYASLPVAILIALVLYVNQVPDREGDAAVGKRTLIVRWSPAQVRTAYAISTGTAFGLIVVGPLLGITPWWTLIALATAPLARSVLSGLRTAYDRPYELMPAMQKNIALHFAAGLALVAGWIVATLVG
jgi:1,4-dihydroxy-2-naphthoate octaprenyltransferase